MTQIMDEELSPQLPSINITKAVIGIGIVILLFVILQHNLAFQKKSTIVLPAGGTYLGPQNAPNEAPATPAPAVANKPAAKKDVFTVTSDTPWITVKGNVYPYSFSSPKTLKLVTFPGENKYDIYAISWNNLPPDQNVLIGVDNLNNSETSKQYIATNKRGYVETWYKQFGLRGVGSIVEFTNSKGLKGYRAKYLNAAGETPNEDIFLEATDPSYVIHLASGILDTSVFDKIIDSISWTMTK
jgi:hypothetical protein